MQILIIGGTHGGEHTGPLVVDIVSREKPANIKGIIAHPQAVKMGVRFLETDLNRSANKHSTHPSLEEHLANKLAIAISRYDMVFDIHNTTAKDNTCLILTHSPTQYDYLISNILGIDKVLVIPSPHNLISNAKIGYGIEISNSDTLKFTPEYIYNRLSRLTDYNTKIKNDNTIQVFEYYKNIPKNTILGTHRITNFQPLPKEVQQTLGLHGDDFLPIFYGEAAYKDSDCSIVKNITSRYLQGADHAKIN